MPRRRTADVARPIYVFVGEEPPAELIEAARRGECIVAHGDRPKDLNRWADALARFADAVIDRDLADTDRIKADSDGTHPRDTERTNGRGIALVGN
jgi:hypothetical protein